MTYGESRDRHAEEVFNNNGQQDKLNSVALTEKRLKLEATIKEMDRAFRNGEPFGVEDFNDAREELIDVKNKLGIDLSREEAELVRLKASLDEVGEDGGEVGVEVPQLFRVNNEAAGLVEEDAVEQVEKVVPEKDQPTMGRWRKFLLTAVAFVAIFTSACGKGESDKRTESDDEDARKAVKKEEAPKTGVEEARKRQQEKIDELTAKMINAQTSGKLAEAKLLKTQIKQLQDLADPEKAEKEEDLKELQERLKVLEVAIEQKRVDADNEIATMREQLSEYKVRQLNEDIRGIDEALLKNSAELGKIKPDQGPQIIKGDLVEMIKEQNRVYGEAYKEWAKKNPALDTKRKNLQQNEGEKKAQRDELVKKRAALLKPSLAQTKAEREQKTKIQKKAIEIKAEIAALQREKEDVEGKIKRAKGK